jgi:hypothetical protein
MSAWTAPKDVARKTQQATLHSFWNLPRQAVMKSAFHGVAPMIMEVDSNGSRCQECDVELVAEEDSMDLDGPVLSEEMACRQCRRVVCDRCAVGCMELRRCLRCVSR